MATIPEIDNRIAFPPTEIDFDGDVGITGQAHDDFPAPGQQPRADWMRLFLIGLLAHQSSDDPPTQFRTGTVWFNRIRKAFYVWYSDAWHSLADTIAVMENTDGSIMSLADWFLLATEKLNSIQPRITYGGSTINDNVVRIPVPLTVQSEISDIVEFLHPLVYINGSIVDPRNTRFSEGCPSYIELLNGINLDTDDRFTVIIEQFNLMLQDDVIAT